MTFTTTTRATAETTMTPTIKLRTALTIRLRALARTAGALLLVAAAGLAGPDQQTPAPVRVKHGAGAAGKTLHYYLNYSGQTQTVTYPYADGTDLLTRKPVARGQAVALAPWDLVIVEER